MNKIKLIPFAITDIDAEHVCVAGIGEDGTWIRPEPILRTDIDVNSYFAYGHMTEFYVEASTAVEKRIEDKDYVREKPTSIIQELTPDETKKIIQQRLDDSVEEIFASGRSIGFIKPKVIDITYGRNLGGSNKIRLIFTDQKGAKYNLIVVERKFKGLVLKNLNESGQLDIEKRQKILEILSKTELYFSVGLSRKNTSFPGPYDGCHALVVGIHAFPDYSPFL